MSTKTSYGFEYSSKSNGSYRNIYGSHPFYLDTRYYESDASGNLTPVTNNESDATANYVSYSHGLYSRNAHGQEILLRPSNITVRRVPAIQDLHSLSVPHINGCSTSPTAFSSHDNTRNSSIQFSVQLQRAALI